ncbi:MAG: hypothetical protein FJW63_06155 [Actinobacteria bacterium]|nr:hypothetical protein [Actinomycetota bacterium]
MSTYSITKTDWDKLLVELFSEYDLYSPKGVEGGWTYQLLTKDNIAQISYESHKYCSIDPLKIFFSPVKETVTDNKEEEVSSKSSKKRVIVGLKSCDLAALSILDRVFLSEDFIDPFYKEKRENTILMSSDCLDAKESCFCTEVGGNPFPEKDSGVTYDSDYKSSIISKGSLFQKQSFDLNLTLLDNEFLVEVGSEKGKRLIEANRTLFSEAKKEAVQKREEKREGMKAKVRERNKVFSSKVVKSFQDIIKAKDDSILWKELSEDCVECGACTNICPTCHCFLLIDSAQKEKFFKDKTWDSCQFNGFARMAGGADPSDELWKRFRNRYLCKYSYKPENFGFLACTGCGRCIDACQGKIDKREVLNKVTSSQ